MLASATATLGTLKVFTDGNEYPAEKFNIMADAYSVDNISFSYRHRTIPGIPSLFPLNVRLNFNVFGLVDNSGDSNPGPTVITLGWKSELLDGSTVIGHDDGKYSSYTYPTNPYAPSYFGTKPGAFSYLVPYNAVIGKTLRLHNDLHCESDGGGICDGSHSFDWGGADLLDENGQKMDGLEIASDSGFDYTQPTARYLAAVAIPEPSSWILMMTGLGAFGRVLCRRRTIASSH